MKFGQLIKNEVTNIFLKKSYRKRGRETSSRSPIKALHNVTTSGQYLSFNIQYFSRPRLRHTVKANFTTFRQLIQIYHQF